MHIITNAHSEAGVWLVYAATDSCTLLPHTLRQRLAVTRARARDFLWQG